MKWLLAIMAMFLTAACAPRDRRNITVHADRPIGECYRFWAVENFNHPSTILEPGAGKRIRAEAPFCRELNCVYMLGGRWPGENNWFQSANTDGTVNADFSGMIEQLTHGYEWHDLSPKSSNR